MTGFDPQAFAAGLLAARRGGVAASGVRPESYEDGLLAARALAGLMGADPPAGFKLGATAERMRDYLGVGEPIAGAMAADGVHGSGSVLSFNSFRNVGVECELAVVLGRDLPPGGDPAAACAELMASIELVENRYGDPPLHVPVLVADGMFHAACVLGEPLGEALGEAGTDWRSLDLLALEGTLAVDGVERGRGVGAELLGGPMEALGWLAGSREARAFGGLRAGQVVTLGSVTTPVWLSGPCTVVVSFPPLPAVTLTLV